MVMYEIRLKNGDKWVSIGKFNKLQTKEMASSYIKELVDFQVVVLK